MGQLEAQAAVGDLRLGERLPDIVDRAARHAGGLERIQPVTRCALFQRRSHFRHELPPMGHARRIGREALVAGQLGAARRGAETRKLTVVADRQHQETIGCRERLVRHDVGMGCAPALRRLARQQVVETLVGERAELGIEQGEVDVWPAPERCRSNSAPSMALTAYMPAMRSATATPTFCGPAPGSPSGTPVMLMSPLMAWIIASYPGTLRSGPSCPNAEMEQ